MEEQPRPVVVDPSCRATLTKLLHLVSLGEAKSPWILCRDDSAKSGEIHIPMETSDGKFSWRDILSTLTTKGVHSVMIEGGATVINDILSEGVADIIIITIAPVFLGRDGVGILPKLQEEWLRDVRSISVGQDVVVAGRVKR